MKKKDKESQKGSTRSKKGGVGNRVKDTTAGLWSDFRYGKTVSVSFFKNNAWLLILFVSIVLALIGVKYKTRTKMAEIKKLEKELVISESDMLREKAAYMTLIRETEMLRLVEKNGLGLEFQEQPPYEITLYEN